MIKLQRNAFFILLQIPALRTCRKQKHSCIILYHETFISAPFYGKKVSFPPGNAGDTFNLTKGQIV